VVFAVERKLAASLAVVSESGFHPWWSYTREVALKWRPSAEFGFVSAPEGFSSQGGWWTDISGVVSALPMRWSQDRGGYVLSTFDGEWTDVVSRLLLGWKLAAKSVVFPAGMIALGKDALRWFDHLESCVVPPRCAAVGKCALRG
jgi:hypothetical protein